MYIRAYMKADPKNSLSKKSPTEWQCLVSIHIDLYKALHRIY